MVPLIMRFLLAAIEMKENRLDIDTALDISFGFPVLRPGAGNPFLLLHSSFQTERNGLKMRSKNMKHVNVEVMGGCGEEVPDKDGLKEEIGIRLLYAIPNLIDVQDLERAVECIYDLMKLRPTEAQRWRPKEGDTYFKIDSDGEIHKVIWHEDDLDRKFWAFGNCFKTAADAYMARQDIKKTLDNFHQHRDS